MDGVAIEIRGLSKSYGDVEAVPGIDPYLTVAETIDMYRGYYPHPRPVDEIVEVVGLREKRDTRVSKLSGGQQRRLDVAIALAGDPTVLFLDEPTTGFDPAARRNAWVVVKNLQALGKTIFLTTHYMDEAQVLALRQVRYTNTAFWRNPAQAFFTFAFPLMFLVIFTALFGNNTVTAFGREISTSTFYVSAIAAFSIITATYTNLAI